jgi:serine/threonine-protein kinase
LAIADTAPAQPSHGLDLEAGTTIARKYRVLSQVGKGGMGAVYLAQHEALGQRVAIKVLAGREEAETARFFREARAAAKLRSEYVVRVSDVGTEEGVGPYMVMELLVGADLAQILDATGPLSVEDAVDAVVEACAALGNAHAHGIVHRDIKPSNMFLAQRSGLPSIVKVLDFGISKLTELDTEARKLTETRTLMGSPHYMSPEQLRSAKDVDGRSDIWSLGVVLYELLTAKMPFAGDSIGAVFAAILETVPVPLRKLRPEVPPTLESAVTRCLARERSDRFQYALDFAAAIAPFGTSRARVAMEHGLVTAPLSSPSFSNETMLSAQSPRAAGATTPRPGEPTGGPYSRPSEPMRAGRGGMARWIAAGFMMVVAAGGSFWGFRALHRTPVTKELPPATAAAPAGVASSGIMSGSASAIADEPTHVAPTASAATSASASASAIASATRPVPTTSASVRGTPHRPRTPPPPRPAPPADEPKVDLDRRR